MINVIVGANTGLVHAVTPAGLSSPDKVGRYRTACHARIVGLPDVRPQDAVTCYRCRTKPLHLPHYAADDEPSDAGPFVCAECGTSEAVTYVVTFLGGDQDDPTGRTEVCKACHDALEDAPAMAGSDAWISAQQARYDELTPSERRELALWVVARDIVGPSTPRTHTPGEDCDGGASCPWHADRTHQDDPR